MNKAELVTKTARTIDESIMTVDRSLSGLTDQIKAALIAGDTVSLREFGTFKVVDRAERTGVNPQTQEPIVIPARKAIVFDPSDKLKELVN